MVWGIIRKLFDLSHELGFIARAAIPEYNVGSGFCVWTNVAQQIYTARAALERIVIIEYCA